MAEPLIISNTTPLINFAEVGRMDLLQGLFGTLVIPPAVQRELAAKPALFPSAARVAGLPFVRVQAPPIARHSPGVSGHLHAGESECLALAQAHPGALLLLDDLAAREFAAGSNFVFTGTLGCLVAAKRRGLLPAIAPVLSEMKRCARFWISARLEQRILSDAQEA